jgi:hypothetical protein
MGFELRDPAANAEAARVCRCERPRPYVSEDDITVCFGCGHVVSDRAEATHWAADDPRFGAKWFNPHGFKP